MIHACTPPFTFPKMVSSYSMQTSSRERRDLLTIHLKKRHRHCCVSILIRMCPFDILLTELKICLNFKLVEMARMQGLFSPEGR